MDSVCAELPGADRLIGFLGAWPSFLDSEVLSITLSRIGKSTLRIHTFESTGQVGAGGYFCLNKHVIVTFVFEGVTDCELAGFNHQNVVNGIAISNQFQSYELTLNGIFGLTGRICSKSIEIEFEVGKPAESQYRE